MDHLPSASEPSRPPLEVPYLCYPPFVYDGEGFWHFPEKVRKARRFSRLLSHSLRSGRPIDLSRNPEDPVEACGLSSINDILAFLQAWLYFGMLSEVLSLSGIKVELGKFVKINALGKPVVSTANLMEHITYWLQSEHQTPRTEKQRRYGQVKLCIRNVVYRLRNWESKLCEADTNA